MKKWGLLAGRVAVTLTVVALALMGGRWLWVRYNVEPWTRDGRIRADIVQVSPDINALVTEVRVKNDQIVQAGDTLFVLDQPRYELALRQADAAVTSAEVALAQARRENARNKGLTDLVTSEQVEEGQSKVDQLAAQLNAARVASDLARLNLERTTVRAPVNGVVTNVELQPGDYASAGHQVLALVATDTLHVDGYFEETKLPRIRVGDRAVVRIMGIATPLPGQVVSIAAGIEDRERAASSSDLANVNPSFSWVRLAQRIPVRVKLDPPPGDVRLIAGRTAAVSILEPPGRALEGQSR
jgi:RND family efflux transporter MFP subunit